MTKALRHKVKKNPEQLLMEKIDQGLRAGVRHTWLKHKREGTAIAIWEKGKIKVIPPNKIQVKYITDNPT